jgi:hypothetical protein
MSECFIAMLQPSLHSVPERLGGGPLWIFFVLSVSYVSQHFSVHVVFTYVLVVADIQQYGTNLQPCLHV